MVSRKLVYRTLDFEMQAGDRIPRHLWWLPWAEEHYPGAVRSIQKEFPDDICNAIGFQTMPVNANGVGDMYAVGTYVDEWGCIFENRQSGIIGEVKTPIVEDWNDTGKVHIPEEALSINISQVNAFCKETDLFVIAGACQRPFERLQFIRGTEELYCDLAMEDKGLDVFIKQMHEFYMKELDVWSKTDVDALFIMDDWGTQKSLLIHPDMWRKIFKPLYKEYISFAHDAGKKIFMHSDGYIVDIYPDLIELGLDAINSQVFCMTPETLSQFAGEITFWGEMDRQWILPEGTKEEVGEGVERVYENLYRNGGVIGQCEFGPGANLGNVRALYEAWNCRNQT